jgi:hypothetical protein
MDNVPAGAPDHQLLLTFGEVEEEAVVLTVRRLAALVVEPDIHR